MKSIHADGINGWLYGSEMEHKELKQCLRELLHECGTGQATAIYWATENAMSRPAEGAPLEETGEQAITIVFKRTKGPWEYLQGQQKLQEAE